MNSSRNIKEMHKVQRKMNRRRLDYWWGFAETGSNMVAWLRENFNNGDMPAANPGSCVARKWQFLEDKICPFCIYYGILCANLESLRGSFMKLLLPTSCSPSFSAETGDKFFLII